MKPSFSLVAVTAAVFALPSLKAEDVPLAACPAPVQTTINANTEGGRVNEVEVSRQGGTITYIAEVALGRPLRERKVYVTAEGNLLKIRDDISLGDTPEAVQKAARKLAGESGRIEEVEKETANGRVIYFVEIDRPANAGNDVKAAFNEQGEAVSTVPD